MAVVSSHQIRPFTSPVNTTGPVDANLVRGNDNIVRNAYVAHDADATIHFQSSTLASRPAAGVVGRKWMTEDTGVARLWYDTGTGWVELTIASNVVGPASATDNAVARFDGTTGKLIQSSAVTIADTGATTIAAGSATPALTVRTTGASQLRLEYDVSNFVVCNVSSTGAVSLNATGTNSSFQFSSRIFSSLSASGNFNADFTSTAASGTLQALAIRGTAINLTTTGTISAIRGVTGTVSSQGVGATTNEASALYAEVSRFNGTIVSGYGLFVAGISSAMTNAHGIRVANVTGGTSQNYAILTGLGTVRFGGTTTELSQATTGNAIVVVGAGTQVGGAFMRIDAPAGQYSHIAWRTGNLDRWTWYRDNTAESGGNVGSEMSLAAFTDAGVFIDNVIRIQRFTGGQMTLSRPISHTAATILLGQQTAAASIITLGAATTSGSVVIVRGTVAGGRYMDYQSGAVSRWRVGASTTAESGANAGSNYFIQAHDDAGAAIDTPVTIFRAAGGTIQTARPVDINVSTGLRVLGTKVVGAQGATITDPTGGVVIDAEARTAIITIIDRLQAHGLIA